jgi:hypothetical protein
MDFHVRNRCIGALRCSAQKHICTYPMQCNFHQGPSCGTSGSMLQRHHWQKWVAGDQRALRASYSLTPSTLRPREGPALVCFPCYGDVLFGYQSQYVSRRASVCMSGNFLGGAAWSLGSRWVSLRVVGGRWESLGESLMLRHVNRCTTGRGRGRGRNRTFNRCMTGRGSNRTF